MATYKVIQDIEAEDKLVGPLTLRQFIYAGISAVCLYICFLAITKHVVFMVGIFLPVAVVTGFFAFPWKGEQPTEIWALARLRFMIKPRVRIWNQSGMKNLVTITAPRKLEDAKPRTNNLSEHEVQSRLRALADTIDSRGWATRNAAYAAYYHRGSSNQGLPGVLAGSGSLQPNAVPSEAYTPASDIFDDQNSVAQNFSAMLNRSSQNNRQRVVQQMQQASMPQTYRPPVPQANAYQQPAAAPYMSPQLPAPIMPAPAAQPYAAQQPAANNAWFMSNPSYPPNAASPAMAPAPQLPPMPAPAPAPLPRQPQQPQQNVFYLPGEIPIQTGPLPMPMAAAPTVADQEASERIKQNLPPEPSINYGHMKVLQPLEDTTQPKPSAIDYGAAQPAQPGPMPFNPLMPMPAPAAAEPVTRKADPAILELANNDDLDVATIARQANKEIRKSPDEVEIRLH